MRLAVIIIVTIIYLSYIRKIPWHRLLILLIYILTVTVYNKCSEKILEKQRYGAIVMIINRSLSTRSNLERHIENYDFNYSQ